MAKYKKKQAKLKKDVFRDRTMEFLERLGDRLEGKGRTILYILAGIVVAGALVVSYTWWSNKKRQEAYRAFGRAVEISRARVDAVPPVGSTELTFPSEEKRAEAAISEFEKVAEKYGNPYRKKARYFVAVNRLILDRGRGIAELEALSNSGDEEVAALSKFALAQAREATEEYDSAASLYADLARMNSVVIPADAANLRLAAVYEKQGKKKEAVDLLFQIVESSRKAKDKDGKPLQISNTAREAARKLEAIDSDRYAQLPPEPISTDFSF